MGTNAYMIFKTIPFNGYKMQEAQFAGKDVVAIPEKRMKQAREQNKILAVIAKKDPAMSCMEFKGDEPPLSVGEFEDKYGREGKYKLYYYVWNPKRQLGLPF